MILINLLPHRELKRLAQRRDFFAKLILSALVGLALAAVSWAVLTQMISAREQRNAYLRAEITKLDVQIKEVAILRSEINALLARLRAIDDLHADRNLAVRLLNELVRVLPEGMQLRSLTQTGRDLVLSGVAHSSERVAELMRNTSQSGVWLDNPELIDVKAVDMPKTEGVEGKRAYEFSVRMKLRRVDPDPALVRLPAPPAS
ncbi:MAG: PilN domain-containing protein [Rubrivivax sp.]